jgi:transcriptional regulator with XRE-family HTH domain
MSAFGERLKSERLRLGMGQETFAGLGGVNRNAQAHYESGTRSPTADYLMALSSAGVDITYLMTGQRSVVTLSTEESAILDNYNAATTAGRRAARSVLLTLTQQQRAEGDEDGGVARSA